LGFRGEALAAIAAVAHVTVVTRTAAELEGTRLVALGAEQSIAPAASPTGCSVAVADLYYNTPARRRFLKSPMREVELCHEAVVRYALAYPSVAFKLTVDGRERLVAPPASPLERFALAVGREAAGEMLPIAWEAGDQRVYGLISSPAVGRARRDRQYFFLNRRPIRSGLLAVMLERPYAGRLPPGRYPLAVVHLELDPSLVDVNVHPRKAEVRFAQERAVYGALGQAVADALSPYPVHEMWGTPGWPFPETPMAPAGIAEPGVSYQASGRPLALGQVKSTYIVAATFDGLVVVDQHAAHESVLAEQLLGEARPISLSPPARIDVTPHEADLLDANLGLLADLGLELEPFGGASYALRSLPAPLAAIPPRELLADLIEELPAGRRLAPDELREKVAHKAACRAAVKAGDLLTPEQQQALLDDLMAAWSPAPCPHGRPALFTLSVEEIERRFLRR
ncbi:MAG TPA: DNA mismatch repair endonuclease MutL, partial [Anaerolineae bacterium]|nr:DNA mismatch repair endonuclease MutL [Anaerolineae bacterium]